jgi:hypothetical protein
MKRCPQCSFIYLDADEYCDLDGTLLSHADDRELEDGASDGARITIAPAARSKTNRWRLIPAVALGLIVGVILFIVYNEASRRAYQTPSVQRSDQQTRLAEQRPNLPAVPAPIESSSPSPTPATTQRVDQTRPGPNPPVISHGPVSTTMNVKSGSAQALIWLTNGARIEADEVWRTTDGIWYRSNGIVTMIKSNRVKQISKLSAK